MSTYNPVVEKIVPLIRMHGPLELSAVSELIGVDPDEIRRQLAAYSFEAMSSSLRPFNPAYVFIDPISDDGQPSDADVVGIQGDPDSDLIGVEIFDASVFGPLYEAADDLLNREPGNAELSSAVAKLRDTFLPGIRPRAWHRSNFVAKLNSALADRRKVRISYSRAWNPGSFDRVVEPLAIQRTGRGYELDAGPVGEDGSIRTYLVSRISALEMLDERFEFPPDVDRILEATRRTTAVTGFGPQHRMWAIHKWAESVERCRDDADDAQFVAQLLPPVEWRAALMQIDAGSEMELDEDSLRQAAVDLARDLLKHHGLTG
jgi:WYL domain